MVCFRSIVSGSIFVVIIVILISDVIVDHVRVFNFVNVFADAAVAIVSFVEQVIGRVPHLFVVLAKEVLLEKIFKVLVRDLVTFEPN